MYRNFRFLLLIIMPVLLYGCGLSQEVTTETFESKTKKFENSIEREAFFKNKDDNYQSLSYGELTIFKPLSFVQLDSVYAIKQNFLDRNDMRGYRKSGIEELIPGYRAAAQKDIDKVQYEMEHVYQTSVFENLTIHHDYYTFDYQDSLLNVTEFYKYTIDKKSQDFYYAYEFRMHFVDDRDLYISKAEQDFIIFFKQRERELIRTDELSPFMKHTMTVMEMAKKAGTVDFREVSKWIAMRLLAKKELDLTIEDFGELFAFEKEGVVQGYELKVAWKNNENDKKEMETTFTFSPYLELSNEVTVEK